MKLITLQYDRPKSKIQFLLYTTHDHIGNIPLFSETGFPH